MKKLLLLLGIFITVIGINIDQASAQEYRLDLTLFYSKTCPHCKKVDAFLTNLEKNYPIKITKYEITTSRRNLELFMEVGKKLEANTTGVPFLVIGDKYIAGYADDTTTGKNIEELVQRSIDEKVTFNIAQEIINKQVQETQEKKQHIKDANQVPTRESLKIQVPFIGQIETNELSLPIFTFVIALVDGFNPCAMWILLFLIGMLVGTKDIKRLVILGGVFILTSGLVYFLFLATWLNFFMFVGYALLARTAIGILALGLGGYNIYKFFQERNGGCDVIEEKNRNNLFEKIKKVIKKKSLLWATLGIIAVAASINLVEMLCSAGLPAVYTKVLSMAQLSPATYYIYLLGYVLVFMLDDLIVFLMAIFTLETVGIARKYSNYTKIIGGIVMLFIGLSLLFRPELVMF